MTRRSLPEQDFPSQDDSEARLRFLARYAALAPSSHNTQPWRFQFGADWMAIRIDETGWLRVADEDQRELHISIGCALENLLIAAEHFGCAHRTVFYPKSAEIRGAAAVVELGGSASDRNQVAPRKELFAALCERHTNRKTYQDHRPDPNDLEALKALVLEGSVELILTDDADLRRTLETLVERADRLQFADPAWRRELAYWFGQGALGTPWLTSTLGRLILPWFDFGKSLCKEDLKRVRSAPLLGVFTTAGNDRIAQIEVGQALERLWLKATLLGLSLQPMNQVLQLPQTKHRLFEALGADRTPQILFRLGYAAAPETMLSPRRELEASMM